MKEELILRGMLCPVDANEERMFSQLLAKIKAEAWEEGKVAAVDSDCHNPACGSCAGCDTILVNPYKEESE